MRLIHEHILYGRVYNTQQNLPPCPAFLCCKGILEVNGRKYLTHAHWRSTPGMHKTFETKSDHVTGYLSSSSGDT